MVASATYKKPDKVVFIMKSVKKEISEFLKDPFFLYTPTYVNWYLKGKKPRKSVSPGVANVRYTLTAFLVGVFK